jgi:hypothetical protein
MGYENRIDVPKLERYNRTITFTKITTVTQLQNLLGPKFDVSKDVLVEYLRPDEVTFQPIKEIIARNVNKSSVFEDDYLYLSLPLELVIPEQEKKWWDFIRIFR